MHHEDGVIFVGARAGVPIVSTVLSRQRLGRGCLRTSTSRVFSAKPSAALHGAPKAGVPRVHPAEEGHALRPKALDGTRLHRTRCALAARRPGDRD